MICCLKYFHFFYHNFKHTKGSANIYKPNKKILVILTTCINTNTLRKQKSLLQRIVRQTIKKGSINDCVLVKLLLLLTNIKSNKNDGAKLGSTKINEAAREDRGR